MIKPEWWSTPRISLDDTMGGDLRVVQKARSTVGKGATKMPKWGPKLISTLMKKRHGTPFEAAVFEFTVECSIRVAREWFRHRIGSFNEFSLRVSEANPVFYVPKNTAVRTEVDRYEFEPIDDPVLIEAVLDRFCEAYDAAWAHYTWLIEKGVAKELAANVLPMGIYTKFGWTVNARSLMNFLELRTAEDAMFEIRQGADMIEQLFRDAMPDTWIAWDSYGRKAP